jgi:hypothetical protein
MKTAPHLRVLGVLSILSTLALLASCAGGAEEAVTVTVDGGDRPDAPQPEPPASDCPDPGADPADASDVTVEILVPATDPSPPTYSITYLGRAMSLSNFQSPVPHGQHFYYFPNFNKGSVASGQRTDKNMVLHRNGFKKLVHHKCYPPPSDRTFSCDALGDPPGVKTRGGPYAGWATFTLPDGTVGRSGTFYDRENRNNNNNSVNNIFFSTDALQGGACVNLVTDNTGTGDRQHNPNKRLRARSNRVEAGVDVPASELSFDGEPDVHTFLYLGHKDGDKLRFGFRCDSAGCPESNKGAGLGGIMVSAPETCTAVMGATSPADWKGLETEPHVHDQERGLNRLLVFTAHGSDCEPAEVTQVSYGGMPMTQAVARTQRADKTAHTSIWYLAESELRAATDATFSVTWSREPAARRFSSAFLYNVDQEQPITAISTAGCNECDALACAELPVDDRRMILAAATHGEGGVDYAYDGDLSTVVQAGDGSSSAAVGSKSGRGADEVGGVTASASGTQAKVCMVVNRRW